MKRIIIATLSLLVIFSLLTVASLAETVKPFEEDYVGENDIVLVGLNGIRPFLGNLANVEALEETCFWLADYADAYNIKFVSYNGRMSSGSSFNWSIDGSPKGLTREQFTALCPTDERAIKEYTALKNASSILTDAGIAYGVSIHRDDYYSSGLERTNLLTTQMTVSDYIGDAKVKCEFPDSNNFAITFEQGDERFIVYQLEAYPRLNTLTWFNQINSENPDRRAFIFTTSFVDKSGEMFTHFDPTMYNNATAPSRGNSNLVTAMVGAGKPHDGEWIWNNSLKNHDNIVMIMSANDAPGKKIVTSSFKNERGYEVVSVLSNLINGYASSGAYPVLIKYSEEDKTLDVRYAVPYANKVGGYIEESLVKIDLKNLASLPDPDPIKIMPKISKQINGDNKAYINGYAGNVFKPQANMTKAEASAIFARLLVGSQTLPTGNTTRFADVKPGDWYYDAIAYLDTNGFYFTNTNENYYPNQPITRAEFVELAYFASELDATEQIKFKDVPESHKYYDAIIAAAASGLVNGYEDNTFHPDATITRAEVVTIINRMLTLVATDRTVDKTHVANVFSDISGHWAEYQILMSSNNNVHSEEFYKIDKSIFTESATSISFENKHIRVKLGKKTGKVEEVIYLPTGETVNAPTTSPWFTYLVSEITPVIDPVKLELVDGRLKFTYKDGTVLYFIIEVHDNFFSVALDTNLPKNITRIVFGNMYFDYKYSEDPESFRASGVIMDTRVSFIHYQGLPGGVLGYVQATTRPNLGVDTIGAKYGIVFSRAKDHRLLLQDVVLAIDPKYGVTSDHGAAFVEEQRDLHDDYAIVHLTTLKETNVDELARSLAKYSFDQVDIHCGPGFITIDPVEFKRDYVDVFHKYGVKVGLHTYSSCLSLSATHIISNPQYMRQIDHNEKTYTLRSDLTKFTKSVKTEEDATGFTVDAYNTNYILIDNEIMKVQKGTSSGFINISRGQFGTTAAEHKAGAEIRQLQGSLSSFQPVPGTSLFYHLAEETARIYNEADFDMIYLDGLESLARACDSTVSYYHYAEFYRTVVSNCVRSPIIEDSASVACNWTVRGRAGATDSVKRAVKNRTLSLIAGKLPSVKQYYTSTIGWFNFDPDGAAVNKNLINKTMFHDDLDAIGSLGIAYDFSNVDNSFSVTSAEAETRKSHNLMYYSVYSRLRKGQYFAPEVREAIKKGENEYRVFQKDDGKWAFREMKYVYNRVYNYTEDITVTGKAENPFPEHTPFIRIEQRFSTLGENEKLVFEIDETAEVSTILGIKNITSINLSDLHAVKVKVYGNGSETGGVCIALSSSKSTYGHQSHTAYYIPTSHKGWKEFILAELENGDHPGDYFKELNETGNAWHALSTEPLRSAIDRINILAHGDVAGVKLDDIKAYTLVDSPVKNPSVTINGSTITFNTELKSGEFIEYYPDTNKAYLNYYVPKYLEPVEKEEDDSQYGIDYSDDPVFQINAAYAKEITFSGSVKVPEGKFTYKYGGEALTSAPLRAEVTIGLQGEILENPESWVAPEIDMGEATLNPLYDLD